MIGFLYSGRVFKVKSNRISRRIYDSQVEMQFRQISASMTHYLAYTRWPEDVVRIQKNNQIATASFVAGMVRLTIGIG
jgi:hypothetical protein